MSAILHQWKVNNNRVSIASGMFVVSQMTDGSWQCGCPAWTKTVPRRKCAHIRWVQRENPAPEEPLIMQAEKVARKIERASVRADLIEALKGMLEDWRDHFGEDACDCRPEPENAGHVCNVCKASLALKRAGVKS